MAEQCACGGKTMMVFPCSGVADVGEVADRAARLLSRKTGVKMSCLAGKFDKYAKPATGWVFIAAGLYSGLKYIFGGI